LCYFFRKEFDDGQGYRNESQDKGQSPRQEGRAEEKGDKEKVMSRRAMPGVGGRGPHRRGRPGHNSAAQSIPSTISIFFLPSDDAVRIRTGERGGQGIGP
jgi:hypothetical protein